MIDNNHTALAREACVRALLEAGISRDLDRSGDFGVRLTSVDGCWTCTITDAHGGDDLGRGESADLIRAVRAAREVAVRKVETMVVRRGLR